MANRCLSLLSLVSLAACAPELPETSVESSYATEHAITEGSAEARALVAFLNHPSTNDAALKTAGIKTAPARASTLAHRNGADGVLGTNDDDSFDGVSEFDAVNGIGVATIQKVAGFALVNGWGKTNGLYLDVYFTEKQVDRTLELVNAAPLAELDVDAYLDKRAAQNIIAARPITSMAELTSISRVKATALRLLRDHADRTLGPQACDSETPCASGLWCTGGAVGNGVCVDGEVDGDGDACAANGVCGEGLVCGGRRGDFAGICRPLWMKDEFANEGAASIPDGPNGSTGMSVDVYGLATVPTDAVIHTRIEHARQGDLELWLENPAGTSVLAWAAGQGPIPTSLVVGVPGDEQANGLWTLQVRDTATGQTGAITLFTLELTTRWD